MNVLVTGGAGYIGSHMVRCLERAGRTVVVLDDLSTGHRDAIPSGVPFVEASVADGDAVRTTLREHGIDAIVHFAARVQVGESVRDPRRYYVGNLAATIALVEAALDEGVRSLVFSSSAAVYGETTSCPITELEPTRPVNAYGETKLAIEHMLASYARAYGLRYAALRYFNAAGAAGGLCERHDPESHLIPIVLDAAAGRRREVVVFGTDYPTPDGTCVRDYVHVSDLADAHLAAIDHLAVGRESGAFNLGSGRGYSVREVIAACEEVSGRDVPVRLGPRRDGDPPVLVADSERAAAHLGWRARRSSLARIVRDAFASRAGDGARHTPLGPGRREVAADVR